MKLKHHLTVPHELLAQVEGLRRSLIFVKILEPSHRDYRYASYLLGDPKADEPGKRICVDGAYSGDLRDGMADFLIRVARENHLEIKS